MAKYSSNTINFTKQAIVNIPSPSSGRTYIYDQKVQSLGVMVYPSGTRTFFLYARSNGRPQKIIIGRFPDFSIDQARIKAMEMKTSIAHGNDPYAEKIAKRKEVTFGELFSRYLEEHAKKHKKSWKFDEEQYDRHIKKEFGSHKLSQINSEKVRKFHQKLGADIGKTGANRVLATISSVFGRATEWAIWNEENPTKRVRKFKQKSRERFLKGSELPKFFKALSEECNTTARDYVLISLLTGARKTNALTMQWKHIDFNAGVWCIPGEESKNGEILTIPLTQEALEILNTRKKLQKQKKQKSKYVFPGSGEAGHLADPKKSWKRILERAEIEDLRLHDLRRTLGSWQAATGANSFIIGKSLGHKSPQSTAIYARLDTDPVRNSMQTAVSAMYKASEAKDDK